MVVTQPDRPKGRGHKLSESPIKKAASKLGYKVKQPNKVNSNKFVAELESLEPDLLVVLAFGQILSQHLLKIPKKGAINIHPSLIPKYRGPAPIQWAIINGDKETGVTTMLMDSKPDTGCVLLSKKIVIEPKETYFSLQARLSKIGSALLIHTINKIQNGSLTPIKQDCRYATTAPMLKKTDGEINWKDTAKNIDSFIRGTTPWPGAFTFYNGIRIKIITASIIERNFGKCPGSIILHHPKKFYVATNKNTLSIEKIQCASGKEMGIEAFLCGCRFPENSFFGCYSTQ